jgi:hypothetical protein
VSYSTVIHNLTVFHHCSNSFNPLIVSLSERGGPSLISYFPYVEFYDPLFALNAFISPHSDLPAPGNIISNRNVNIAHSQGLALIVVLNCYA